MKLFRVNRKGRSWVGALLIVAPTADIAEELATKTEPHSDFLRPEEIWDPAGADRKVRVVYNDELR